jgi:hypothetical protein
MRMTDIAEKIARQIGSSHLSTFFLNAPPGAGKTHLLSTLGDSMSETLAATLSSKLHVLGPYTISDLSLKSFLQPLLQDLKDSFFLPLDVDFDQDISFFEFLLSLRKKIIANKKQHFLVLYDLQDAYKFPIQSLASIFSQIRALGERWKDGDIRFSIITAGCWDHHKLMEHFEEKQTSWSYIPGENYVTMQGVDTEAISSLVERLDLAEKRIPYGDFLFILCGGHPGCAFEVLQAASSDALSFSTLLSSVDKVAKDGASTNKLVEFWSDLPEETKPMLLNLLRHKYLSAPLVLSSNLIQLYDYGILAHKTINERSYLSFRSWYVELVIRYHLTDIGITVNGTLPELIEIIPDATAICMEGYSLVNEIENLVRNFVSAYLWAHKLPSDDHPLKDKLYKFSEEKGREEDAYERALDWKERSLKRKVESANLNPLIAFLSTTSLADLVLEIGQETNSQSWMDISCAIRDMSGVRDAIMHNQIIDDSDLSMLYDIQEKVYKALSQND